MQQPRHHAAARGTVGLAEDELGRVPAVVGAEIALDEADNRARVRVDAPEVPVPVGRHRGGIARTHWVDEDEVALVEQSVGVVLDRVGRGRRKLRQAGPDAARREGSEQQKHRRGARAAVVEKGDRPFRRRQTVGREADVEKLGIGLCRRRIHGHKMAGPRRVWKALAADGRDVVGDRGALGRVGDGRVGAGAVGRPVDEWLIGWRGLFDRVVGHGTGPGSAPDITPAMFNMTTDDQPSRTNSRAAALTRASTVIRLRETSGLSPDRIGACDLKPMTRSTRMRGRQRVG